MGKQLGLPERLEITKVLCENVDLFAWNPEDIVDIDPRMVVHRLNIKPGAKPVK